MRELRAYLELSLILFPWFLQNIKYRITCPVEGNCDPKILSSSRPISQWTVADLVVTLIVLFSSMQSVTDKKFSPNNNQDVTCVASRRTGGDESQSWSLASFIALSTDGGKGTILLQVFIFQTALCTLFRNICYSYLVLSKWIMILSRQQAYVWKVSKYFDLWWPWATPKYCPIAPIFFSFEFTS